MYRILVADDEDIIRKGISGMIRRKRPELNIVCECSSGEAVLEYIKNNPIDIIVTDICMPDKTGLDIAKYVYEKKLPIHIIIISGYEEFEYAKKAIEYKVKSFLTKPVNTAEILKQLDACKEIIDNTRADATNQAMNFVNNFEYFKDKLFAVLKGNITYKSFYDFFIHRQGDLDILGFDKAAVVKFKCEEKTFLDNEMEQIKSFCENASDKYISLFCGYDECSFECIIIFRSKAEDIKLFEDEIKHALALFYSKGLKSSSKEYKGIKHLIASVSAERDADYYFSSVFNKNYDVKEDIIRSLSAVNDKQYGAFYREEFLNKISEYCIVENQSFSSEKEMLDYCAQAAECSKSLIYDIQKYIQDNILNNITVVTVAEHFRLTSGYIGKIYKKKTGKKLIDYILEVKMEKAKELLNEGKMKIEEISLALGYSQSLNFRKQFKKFTGYTPSEFIRKK